MKNLKTTIRLILGAAALFSARSLFADDGTVRVAVSVDVTPTGRAAALPAANDPVYYVPLVAGFEARGAVLTYWQNEPLPGDDLVRDELANALSRQGYRPAPAQSAASVVLVARWGTVAPYIAPVASRGNLAAWWKGRARNRVTNWDEIGTYVIGDKWPELAVYARRRTADPGTQEIFDAIRDATHDTTGGSLGRGARYYLMVSALDAAAFLQHRSVLLWRAHVSTEYWGHSLAQVLPTLIAAGVPVFGRDTPVPLMSTVPLASWEAPMRTPGARVSLQPSPASAAKS